MQFEQIRLLLLGMPDGVHAELPQHQGAVFGEILQTRQVSPEVRPAVEVDIVGKKIRLFGKKIFRGRKVGIGSQRPGILVLHNANQGIKKQFHPLRPVPADQIRRNFVVHVVTQNGRMPGVGLRGTPDAGSDFSPNRPVIEKKNPPLPRDRHHHPQAMLRRLVEKPAGRRVVHPHGVKTRRGNQPEIPGRFGGISQVIVAVPERPVGHALQEKLGVAGKKKLPPGRHPRSAQGGGSDPRLRRRGLREKRNRDGAHSRS